MLGWAYKRLAGLLIPSPMKTRRGECRIAGDEKKREILNQRGTGSRLAGGEEGGKAGQALIGVV